MHKISASQIRAARGLLDWTQDHLADASNLSRATIRNVENGFAVRPGNISEIYKTFENHGIEFLDNEGVKRRSDDRKDYRGPHSCDNFFDDVLATLKATGGGLICLINTQDMLTKASGLTHRTNIKRLEQVQEITEVKCIISDNIRPPFVQPSFPVRVLPDEQTVVPSSCFAYGDQLVLGHQDNSMNFAFAVFKTISFMHHYQSYFLPRWQIARPLSLPIEQKRRRA